VTAATAHRQQQAKPKSKHQHLYQQEQECKAATRAQAPDWMRASDATEVTDNRLIALARRLSAERGSEDVAHTSHGHTSNAHVHRISELDVTGSTSTTSIMSGLARTGGSADDEATATRKTTPDQFLVALKKVAPTHTSGRSISTGDSRSSFLSAGSSMFSGSSGMTGYSEATQKIDNTMGNTIARRAIAEVERELIIDGQEKGTGADKKFDQETSGILTGIDSNDTDASATVEEQLMQHGLHASMRMSAVFEEDFSDGHGSSTINRRSSTGSAQSSEHLERQLRDLHVAQEELRRREEELKREVLVQKEAERRRSSDGGGSRGVAGGSNRRDSSRGGKSSIDTDNGPPSPSPPPVTVTADASVSTRILGSAVRRHSLTDSQESFNVELNPSPEEVRRTSSTSNIPNDAMMTPCKSTWGDDVGDVHRFEIADKAFADGRKAMQEMNYTAAKNSFERALYFYQSFPEEVVEKSVRADIYHALGKIELEIGSDYDNALLNLQNAMRMRFSIGDKLGEAMCKKDIAIAHSMMGQAASSADNFQQCMEIMIAELGEENPRVHEFLVDIGATAKQLSMEKDAIQQFEIALDICETHISMKPDDFQTKMSRCSVLHALGVLEYHVGDLAQSLKHLQQVMDSKPPVDASPTAQDAAIRLRISKIHRKLGNFDEGHEASKMALDTSRQQRKYAAHASHSSGRSLGSISAEMSSGTGKSSQDPDPSVYIHLAEDQSRVSELDSTFSPVDAQAHHHPAEMRYIPFIMVYDEDHKKQIRRDTLNANMMKVYFTSSKARSEACEILYDVAEMMEFLAEDAKQILSSPSSSEKQQAEVLENLLFDGCDVSISMVDDFAPSAYGIEISDRLFWEGFVMPFGDFKEFRRDFIGIFPSTKRQSNPESQIRNLMHFQPMKRHLLAAFPCIVQMDAESPMSPQTLVVGYEKNNQVIPAAPDNWPPPDSTAGR